MQRWIAAVAETIAIILMVVLFGGVAASLFTVAEIIAPTN